MSNALDKAILVLLAEHKAYASDGLLKFDCWKPIAEILNRRGIGTPNEGVKWSYKTLATYYRRHLRGKDPRLKPSTTQ
ncbi:MAG: hypothetical protein WBG50_28710 [Desulfomonilaceae bacterium]